MHITQNNQSRRDPLGPSPPARATLHAAVQPAATEQRDFDRHVCHMPIWFAHFNRSHYSPAMMRNYGEGGIRFSAQFPVKEGAVIVIRLDPAKPVPAGGSCKPGFRNLSLVEVRWCKEMQRGSVLEYDIGGRYF